MELAKKRVLLGLLVWICSSCWLYAIPIYAALAAQSFKPVEPAKIKQVSTAVKKTTCPSHGKTIKKVSRHKVHLPDAVKAKKAKKVQKLVPHNLAPSRHIAKGEKQYKVAITKSRYRPSSIVQVVPRLSKPETNGSVPEGPIRFSPQIVGTSYGGFDKMAAI